MDGNAKTTKRDQNHQKWMFLPKMWLQHAIKYIVFGKENIVFSRRMHGNAKTPLEGEISTHLMNKSGQNHQKRVLGSNKHGRFALGIQNQVLRMHLDVSCKQIAPFGCKHMF